MLESLCGCDIKPPGSVSHRVNKNNTNNIRINLKEIVVNKRNWIDSVKERNC